MGTKSPKRRNEFYAKCKHGGRSAPVDAFSDEWKTLKEQRHPYLRSSSVWRPFLLRRRHRIRRGDDKMASTRLSLNIQRITTSMIRVQSTDEFWETSPFWILNFNETNQKVCESSIPGGLTVETLPLATAAWIRLVLREHPPDPPDRPVAWRTLTTDDDDIVKIKRIIWEE